MTSLDILDLNIQ